MRSASPYSESNCFKPSRSLANGLVELGFLHPRLAQTGPFQAGSTQLGRKEVCHVHVSSAQVGLSQVGHCQVGLGQVGLGQVLTTQILTGKNLAVRPHIRLRDPNCSSEFPHIRGSSGYGKPFEDLNNGDWGHGDLKDAIAGADWLRTQDWVDGAHIGITGTSYGGCLSMSAVCNAPGQFQAAAPHAGYADWVFVTGEQERRHLQLMHYEFGAFPEQSAVYRHCSPINNIRQAQMPTLVLHGEGQLPRSDRYLR